MKTAELVLPFSKKGLLLRNVRRHSFTRVKNAFLPPQSPALSSLFHHTPIKHFHILKRQDKKNEIANFTLKGNNGGEEVREGRQTLLEKKKRKKEKRQDFGIDKEWW